MNFVHYCFSAMDSQSVVVSEKTLGALTDTSGLLLTHKLKYEHIYLTSFSKMRVDLTVQLCYIFIIIVNKNRINCF